MREVLVAIHQPNFLPWLGFLDKMRRADKFVLLDEAQFNRHTYTHRTSVLLSGAPHRIVAPVKHAGTLDLRICDAEIAEESRQTIKMVKSLRQSYGRAPGWARWGEPIAARLAGARGSLLSLNLDLLQILADGFGVDWGKVHRQSNLRGEGTKNHLLASLTRDVGGQVYLAGGSAYNDSAVYEAHGVRLKYQEFEHPVYAQPGGDFIPGLSALDALMWLGDEARHLLTTDLRV